MFCEHLECWCVTLKVDQGFISLVIKGFVYHFALFYTHHVTGILYSGSHTAGELSSMNVNRKAFQNFYLESIPVF